MSNVDSQEIKTLNIAVMLTSIKHRILSLRSPNSIGRIIAIQDYMTDYFSSYNTREELSERIEELKKELQEVNEKFDEAIAQKSPEERVYELGLDIQNIRRKIEYFSERLSKMRP